MAKSKSSASPVRKSASGSRKAAPRRKTQAGWLEWSLRPEHQRELFALVLLAVSAVTVVFFLTGAAGIVGQRWVEATRWLLGWGAMMVPIALGFLGLVILWQERRADTRLTGAMVLGTPLILLALLALLEFGIVPRQNMYERPGEGGGVIGYGTLLLLVQAVGRPAAFVLLCVMGLAGIMLTFDITIRELVSGLSDGLARFWATIWAPSAGRKPAQARQQGAAPLLAHPLEPTAYEPPPGGPNGDLMKTPIAARPTRASLFQRPETAVPQEPPKVESKPKPPPAPAKKADSQAVLANLLNEPVHDPAAPENAQATLDGFGVPTAYHAWPLPSAELLEVYAGGSVSSDEIVARSRLIEETLANFKVEVQVKNVNIGPAVMQFELQPAIGVKVSKITSLERDLALALAASSIRIEAPIPGKNYVGVEIPASSKSTVGLRELIESEEFEQNKSRLRLPLGRDVSGLPIIAGMERMPHLLMAGATGSGKSAGINAFICALLLKHTPDELKLIMVDPKMVELLVYNNVPHLLSPVVTELERVVPTLKWATREMERRYKIFARHSFRNIESYKIAQRRRTDLEPLPYIVIIIDELADLMMMAPDEVETLICRLAQMARATGIHLIIATQRPSVDVVTGLIKANFPSRIAFAVTSQIDSRVILDVNGAEQLLGRGDMLYLAADAARPVRIQGTWVSEPEVERIVDFWKHARPPDAPTDGRTPVPVNKAGTQRAQPSNNAADGDDAPVPGFSVPAEFLSQEEQDELLPEATKLVKQHRRASASLLQRRLRIGYSKAAQLIDLLEQQGIVGPAEEGRSREVLQNES